MAPQIEAQLQQLIELCRRYRVRKLEVFGSAAGDRFDPGHSDVDFLAEFEAMEPRQYAECYLKLLVAMEDLLGRSVDLITPGAVQNPYFRQSLDATRKTLYAA